MSSVNSILVVEDDDTLRGLMQEAFNANGFFCKSAPDGARALDLLTGEPFDFMITDIVMPGMSGFTLTEQVKKRYPRTEVIMMTGFSEADSCRKAVAAGAADFITKPFNFEELLARVERVKQNSLVLEEIRKREHAIVDMSREMIDDIQDEARQARKVLEHEISLLRKKLT